MDIDVEKMEYILGDVFSNVFDFLIILCWIGIFFLLVFKIDYVVLGGIYKLDGIVKVILVGVLVIEICSVIY